MAALLRQRDRLDELFELVFEEVFELELLDELELELLDELELELLDELELLFELVFEEVFELELLAVTMTPDSSAVSMAAPPEGSASATGRAASAAPKNAVNVPAAIVLAVMNFFILILQVDCRTAMRRRRRRLSAPARRYGGRNDSAAA